MLLTRYLSLRSLRARPLRVLLSMFGITIGVAGILAIGIANQAAMDSITRLFEDTSGRVDLMVTAASSDSGFSDSLARSLVNVPGVQIALPILKAQTALASSSAQTELGLSFFGTNSGGLILYGVDPLGEPQARDYTITNGRFLSEDRQAFEVVLVENYADDQDIRVGDRVGILTPYGVEKVQVVGLMAREGPGQTNNGVFGVLPLEAAQQLFNRPGQVDQFDLILDPKASSPIESIQEVLQKRLGADYSVTYPAGQGRRMTQMLSNYQIGLNFLSGIALFVGAFLIYNAFAMTVVERTREFGMLRAIGMTRRQITQQMLVEALVLGTAGSILGVLLGVLGARGLAAMMSTLLGSPVQSQLTIPPASLAVSLSMGMGVTLLAAALPSIQAGRVTPIAAIRIRGVPRQGWFQRHGWKLGVVLLAVSTALLIWNPFADDPLFRAGSMVVFAMFTGITLIIPAMVDAWERWTRPLMAAIYGASGALGSRNIQRARSRTTLTVGALLVGVAMILVVRGLTGSFAADLRVWVESYLGGDVYIHSSVPLRADLARQISAVDGVAAAASIRYQPTEVRLPDGSFEAITYMAVDPAAYSRVTRFVFSDNRTDPAAALSTLAAGDALFISSVLAEKYQWQVGDAVALRTQGGVRTFTVAAVVVDFFNQGLVVTGNWNDLRRYFHSNEASTILVSVRDPQSVAAVQARIDDLYGKRYRLSMDSNASIRARVFNLMDQAFSMFDVLALLSVLVASLGVVNTLTMNVIERTREIGMLRATGMTRRQVILMVMAEAGLMGMIGGLLGLVFGVLLSRIFLTGMTAMSGYRLDFVMPASGILSALVVALVISQLAAFPPARQAARTNVLEAIQYE